MAFGLLHLFASCFVAAIAVGGAIASLTYAEWYVFDYDTKTAHFGLQSITVTSQTGSFSDQKNVECTNLFFSDTQQLKSDCDKYKQTATTTLAVGVIGVLALGGCQALVFFRCVRTYCHGMSCHIISRHVARFLCD